MKVTIKGFIHKSTCEWDREPFRFYSCEDMSDCGFVLVGPHEFEYEVPADFNPVAAEVSALNKELDQINDAHMRKVMQIKGRINDLLALTYTPSATADDVVDA